MRLARCVFLLAGMAASGPLVAAEVTVKNDSLINGSTGAIVAGFVPGEKAASWLTSPCNGNIVAAQIFWRSPTGTAAQVIGQTIEISRAGTFPTPGTLAQTIGGPVLTDGVINEYRYLDENNTVPLIVPVTMNELFVVAFTFDLPNGAGDPSVVRDTDGIQFHRNSLYANVGNDYFWFDSSTLGVTGDWVIRAVIDCPVVATDADVSVAMSALPSLYTPGAGLAFTITVSNAGPVNSPNTTLVDIFPGALGAISWTCTPSGGATCTASGSSNITGNVGLPVGSHVTYAVNTTVTVGTSGILTNTATAVVNSPASDPNGGNNTATVNVSSIADRIFANGFEI